MNRNLKRLIYAAAFVLNLILIIVIALYVNDSVIRPYGGDVLIVVLICCFLRIIFPDKPKTLPLWVFLFAVAVEIGQYFDYVSLLGLGDIEFFKIWLGSTFSWGDIACYLGGCALFALGEFIGEQGSNKNRIQANASADI